MSENSLTLVVTSSYDATTDVLLSNSLIPTERVFRFNYDLIDRYSFEITPESFSIADPVGRIATIENVSKCYLRKFERRVTSCPLEKYADDELWYAVRSMIHLLWAHQRVVLVEPGAEVTRLDKLAQLRTASQFFPIADAVFCHQQIPDVRSPAVVKSLSRGKVGDKVVYANRVDVEALDRKWPWYIHQFVDSRYDVTVVYVRGTSFAFRLDRANVVNGTRVDWKSDRAEKGAQPWEFFRLPCKNSDAISNLMQTMKLDYGRIDFLADERLDVLTFLEVNPNGQFAWLDLNDTHGVISAVCNQISPITDVHPIPHCPFDLKGLAANKAVNRSTHSRGN